MPALTPDEWSSRFQATHDREPTLSEYNAAVTAGEVQPAQASRPRDESLQNMTAGARQMASGARQFVENRVVPAAAGATAAARQGAGAAAERSGIPAWRFWAMAAVPAAALLALISVFLPAARMPFLDMASFSEISGMASELGATDVSEATLLVLALLVAAGLGVAMILVRRTWVRITAGVVAVLVGLLTMLDGFGSVAGLSDAGASPQIGLYLMGLMGLALLAAGIIALLPLHTGVAKAPKTTARID